MSCLENKDRNFVNKKLKEYRCFSRNAKELYEKVRLEIPLLEQETESLEKSLVNFQHLLISFESEIDSIQFWFNEADGCTETKRTLLKKIVVKNNYQSSLTEVDLEKGIYDQEELT